MARSDDAPAIAVPRGFTAVPIPYRPHSPCETHARAYRGFGWFSLVRLGEHAKRVSESRRANAAYVGRGPQVVESLQKGRTMECPSSAQVSSGCLSGLRGSPQCSAELPSGWSVRPYGRSATVRRARWLPTAVRLPRRAPRWAYGAAAARRTRQNLPHQARWQRACHLGR
jgi:hypothetical protein